jgi:hypothetical protein
MQDLGSKHAALKSIPSFSSLAAQRKSRLLKFLLSACFLLASGILLSSRTPHNNFDTFGHQHGWASTQQRTAGGLAASTATAVATPNDSKTNHNFNQGTGDGPYEPISAAPRQKTKDKQFAKAAKAFFAHLDDKKLATGAEPSQPHIHIRRAELPPIEVFEKSPDACASAASVPKVALLFLTRGTFHHEKLWSYWFRSAAGVFPEEVVSNCDDARLDGIRRACADAMDATSAAQTNASMNPIDMQRLFNVYVHSPPTANDSEMGEMWRDKLISHRIEPEWGTHTLVEATRHLVWEAFKDPLNQRFVLVSESDVPLYDPLMMYRQVMSETESRVNAWQHNHVDLYRWNTPFATWPITAGRVPRVMWRKSSQWFSIIREHAEVFLKDEVLFRNFETNCRSGWDFKANKWRTCYSVSGACVQLLPGVFVQVLFFFYLEEAEILCAYIPSLIYVCLFPLELHHHYYASSFMCPPLASPPL